MLDPVSILEEWFAFRPRKLTDEIFSIYVDERKRRLGKQSTINHLKSVWNTRRSKGKQLLHGHSFRIGGASLRWNLGMERQEVKKCGRWASDAYLVYLRKFSDRELAKTVKLLHKLKWDAGDKDVSVQNRDRCPSDLQEQDPYPKHNSDSSRREVRRVLA